MISPILAVSVNWLIFFHPAFEYVIDALNRMGIEQLVNALVGDIGQSPGQRFVCVLQVLKGVGTRRFTDESMHGFAVIFLRTGQ